VNTKSRKHYFRALTALVLAAFIGAQAGLLAHLHTDDAVAADCLQCQLDGKPAIGLPGSELPALAPERVTLTLGTSAARAVIPYRLNAREPPTNSC